MHALTRHVALIGFMGAGKSSIGRELAARLGRPFVDVDRELEQRQGRAIAEIFASDGEGAFREVEERLALELLGRSDPAVIALGGGALGSADTRSALRARALTLWREVEVGTAWERVRRSDRPLARDEAAFRRLYDERLPVYAEAADGRADDVEAAVLAAAGISVDTGSFGRLGAAVGGPVEVVVDHDVFTIHPPLLDVPVHTVPAGERAKTLAVCERIWRELRLERRGTLVAVGGGSTTDVAGFAAAGYMRGVPWIAVPTTLVGQVDAAIGGKTGVDLPEGKNLVGAFHWPESTLVDPDLLATLPERELRNGLAEVVKAGLLAGRPLWELERPEQVRRCAAFKAAVCLRDPHEQGERAMLNLGHTFAHALEAASDYALSHGEAVALGLIAALELSGRVGEAADVAELLRPVRPQVDPERAWQALLRDKKAAGGSVRLVLLDAPGKPRWGVELPADEVRSALERLIA